MLKTVRSWRLLCFALISIAWLISFCLLLRLAMVGGLHLPFQLGAFLGSLGSGCDETLATPASWEFGVPLPGVGIVYFAIVGFLLAFEVKWASRAALLMVSAGAGVSVALSNTLGSRVTAFCVLCLLVNVLNLLLLAAVYILDRQMGSPHAPRHAHLASSRVWGLTTLGIMCCAGLLQAALFRPGLDARKVIEAYRSAPVFNIASSPEDPVLGPREARAELIVFSSFQCPACQSFAQIIPHLREHFGNDLAITFKNYPLGKDCNPLLGFDMQPRACAAAWSAEAANRQKAFWRYHDFLFGYSLEASDEMLRADARTAGLDLQAWDRDRNSESVRSKVRRDVELGNQLRILGTPAVFLNGRRVVDHSLPGLELLIRDQLHDRRR